MGYAWSTGNMKCKFQIRTLDVEEIHYKRKL